MNELQWPWNYQKSTGWNDRMSWVTIKLIGWFSIKSGKYYFENTDKQLLIEFSRLKWKGI